MAGKPSAKRQNSKARINNTSSGRLFSRLALVHASNIIIASVFVLAFAGLGTWYVSRSSAASSACVYQTYGVNRGGQGSTCIKAIQSMLDHFKYGPYVLKSGSAYDGIYGSKTLADVNRFQSKMVIKNGGGEVGGRTWYAMCGLASIQGYNDVNDFVRAGCGNIWSGYIPT